MIGLSAVKLVAALGVVTVLVASCEGNSDVAPGPRATATAPPVKKTEKASEPSLPPEFRRATRAVFDPEDAVVDIAIQEPASLDPMRIPDPGAVLVARQLFEGLTRWDPEAGQVVPAAAQSWDASAGGRRFAFRLRSGMHFHNGAPVTASNFKFAFDRIALKQNASDIAYTLDNVVGFDAVNKDGSSDSLPGVVAKGKRTLIVQLSRPYRDLPAIMTHPGLVPLPRKAVAKAGAFSRVPVGNGSFRMARPWTPGRPVVLKANKNALRPPVLDGLRFVTFPDAAASWIPFVDGDIDVAEVPAGQMGSAEENFGRAGFRPLVAAHYYGFNFKVERFRDVRLRRAISLAIDREAIAKGIYKGTVTPARGIVPAGMPGFEENACAGVCSYDLGAAKALVKKVPKMRRAVMLEFSREPPNGSVAKAIRRDLEAVGLRVKLRALSFGRYVRRLREDDHEMYRLQWIAEFPTPDVFLSSLFLSDSSNNHAGFNSDKIDKMLRKAHSQASPGKRLDLYKRIERALLDKVAVVPLGQFVTHWAAQPGIDGLVIDAMGGFDAATVSLAAED